MRKFKSFVLAMIGLLCSISVSAHDFEADGIYYNITSSTDMTVEVTYREGNNDSYSNEYSGAVNIPESVTYNGNTYSVTSIGSYAFYECSSLTSVEIPNSVTSIGSSAFSSCSGLTSVHIDDIAAWCNIEFHTYDANPLYYAKNLYLNGEKVTELVIPNGVTSIGYCAFAGCSGLTSVEIPNSVTIIGDGTFYECSGLTSVVIPNSVTSIGSYAFYDCDGLTSVVIPNSVTSIGSYAFYDCDDLTSVVIPNSVTSIGYEAFCYCNNLKVVLNNSSFTFAKGSSNDGYIARYAEVVCNGYEQVDDFIFTEEGGACYLRAYIGDKTELVLPANYKGGNYSIGVYAFYHCFNLVSVVIPNNVTSIGDGTFEGCTGLTSIEFPNSVTSIGVQAFRGTPLRTLVSKSDTPATLHIGIPEYPTIDNYTYIHATLYVPEGAYWNYAYAHGWGDFIHIKEMAMTEGALLSNKAYMIADSKGTNFKVYDAERDALKNVEYTHALDEESEDCCWTVMKENGKTYLFNLGAKKFGVVGDNGAITLSETPVHVAISETEGGLSINGNNCMFVLNKHVEVDATGISDVLLNGQDAKNAQIHSLDGRRQQTLKRGVNIVNGKKVFVQ